MRELFTMDRVCRLMEDARSQGFEAGKREGVKFMLASFGVFAVLMFALLLLLAGCSPSVADRVVLPLSMPVRQSFVIGGLPVYFCKIEEWANANYLIFGDGSAFNVMYHRRVVKRAGGRSYQFDYRGSDSSTGFFILTDSRVGYEEGSK